jgi:hypothetical protein
MGIGQILVFPGGWLRSTTEGHAFLVILKRDGTTFSLAVVNLGEGVEYHPSSNHPVDGMKVSVLNIQSIQNQFFFSAL